MCFLYDFLGFIIHFHCTNVSAITNFPRMFLWEYRTELVTMELPSIVFIFPPITMIFCKGVSGFVTGCACGVWGLPFTIDKIIVARLSKSLATLTFGSSKINQHCWRFHGSGVIAAPQIIGLISFCTGMHHEYFFRSPMCFRVPHLCSKIPKINNWTGEFATVIWRLHCFTVSFRGDIRGESGPR